MIGRCIPLKHDTLDPFPRCNSCAMDIEWKPILLLLAALVCAASAGLQPIPILAWLHPFFLLHFLHSIALLNQTWLSMAALLVCTILVQAVGYTLAFANMLNMASSFQFTSTLYVLLIACPLWLLLSLPFLTILQYRKRFPSSVVSHPFAFATVWTAIWHILACISPFGSIGNPAYTQSTIQSLVLTARFWGLEGIVFLMAWSAALAHQTVFLKSVRQIRADMEGSRNLSKEHALHLKVWAVTLLVVLTIGGAQTFLFSGTFFQKSIEQSIKPTVPVSCILTRSEYRMWQKTEERVVAGDALIIWPETAVGTVYGDKGEAALFSKASSVLSRGLKERHKNRTIIQEHGPFLGISYMKQNMNKVYNRLAFILPNGTVGFIYSKTHPVYMAGEDISAGQGILNVMDTSMGRISAAICFDFEFPSLIRQAGNKGVDIMLETAETWGPIGTLEFQSDAFRAVENGFMMLRCSLYGVSGIITPFYQVIDYREGLANSVFTMQLPLSKRTWTFYPFLGFLFGWMVDIVALLYLILSWSPLCFVQKLVMYLPKSFSRFFTSQSADGIHVYELCNGTDSYTANGLV